MRQPDELPGEDAGRLRDVGIGKRRQFALLGRLLLVVFIE